MSTRMNFRSRKVDIKKALPLIKTEDAPDIEALTSQRSAVQIETGVEKEEEEEHHLQAAIKSAQAAYTGGHVASNYIPTPDASKLVDDYSVFYQPDFQQPQEYIKYTEYYDTSIGISYCMDEEDYNFIKTYSDQTVKKINESRFEEILKLLEDAVADGRIDPKEENVKIPDDILVTLKTTFSRSKSIEKQFNAILQHWINRRKKMNNSDTIMPRLRLDRSIKAENDPYLCFRRREIKLQRRTRATDTFYINKLNHLRYNLNKLLSLVDSSIAREEKREEAIHMQEEVLKKRMSICKKRVAIKYDDPAIRDNVKKHEHKASSHSINLNDDIFDSELIPRKKIRRLERLKKKDLEGYTDITDAPYQTPIIPKAETYYTISPHFLIKESDVSSIACRRRFGRGGRIYIDRKRISGSKTKPAYRDSLESNDEESWVKENLPIISEKEL
ncbi:hypothetical protein K502DRAFT_341319 [Neoconidiobolus thromboides FSU 785]|nr:hypothetical protein K502DRAFT_341319 [Neoconidiobolus thromboides FSU 785]